MTESLRYRLAGHVELRRARNASGHTYMRTFIDGEEVTWRTGKEGPGVELGWVESCTVEDGENVEVVELPSVTLRILAEKVTVVDDFMHPEQVP